MIVPLVKYVLILMVILLAVSLAINIMTWKKYVKVKFNLYALLNFWFLLIFALYLGFFSLTFKHFQVDLS